MTAATLSLDAQVNRSRRSYSHYRDSEVDWLGDIPEHWQIKRLKHVASINDENLSAREDPLRSITYVDIGSVDSTGEIIEMEEMVFEEAPSRARRLVREGDTIVSTVRTYLKAIAPICDPPADMIVSTGFAVIRPNSIDPSFASWVLREHGFVEEIVARSTGVSYPAINASKIGDLPVPLPPLNEQRAIADFLDLETERVDALVAKNRLLIERLEEHRTALIRRTLTRGLMSDDADIGGADPSHPLRPSGIDWLGDIPEHWQIKRLKHVASINDENLSAREDPLRSITYVDIGSVDSTGEIIEMEEMVFEEAPSRARRLVREGDTIVSTVRTYLKAIAPICDPPADMIVSTGFAVIHPNSIDPSFASWVLREHGFVEEIVARSTGVSYPAINASKIGDLPVPLPPLNEQRAIADFLNREDKRSRPIISKQLLFTKRLEEYRTSLIAGAVTGKLDIR